jgi:hypothetical protein
VPRLTANAFLFGRKGPTRFTRGTDGLLALLGELRHPCSLPPLENAPAGSPYDEHE